jgi:hypothetical protein
LAKVWARMAGPDKHNEDILTFRQNKDGTFTKIVTPSIRDWKTNQRFKGKIKSVETGPYVMTTNKEEADEVQTFEDINGSTSFIYFKLLELETDTLETEDDV